MKLKNYPFPSAKCNSCSTIFYSNIKGSIPAPFQLL